MRKNTAIVPRTHGAWFVPYARYAGYETRFPHWHQAMRSEYMWHWSRPMKYGAAAQGPQQAKEDTVTIPVSEYIRLLADVQHLKLRLSRCRPSVWAL